jgi:hypothetical protein
MRSEIADSKVHRLSQAHEFLGIIALIASLRGQGNVSERGPSLCQH